MREVEGIWKEDEDEGKVRGREPVTCVMIYMMCYRTGETLPNIPCFI